MDLTGIRVHEDKWRGETVLQSTYTSRLLNLGQVTSSLCPSGEAVQLFNESCKIGGGGIENRVSSRIKNLILQFPGVKRLWNYYL